MYEKGNLNCPATAVVCSKHLSPFWILNNVIIIVINTGINKGIIWKN